MGKGGDFSANEPLNGRRCPTVYEIPSIILVVIRGEIRRIFVYSGENITRHRFFIPNPLSTFIARAAIWVIKRRETKSENNSRVALTSCTRILWSILACAFHCVVRRRTKNWTAEYYKYFVIGFYNRRFHVVRVVNMGFRLDRVIRFRLV